MKAFENYSDGVIAGELSPVYVKIVEFPFRGKFCSSCLGFGGYKLQRFIGEIPVPYWHPCGPCRGTGVKPFKFRPKLP